jgi:hypothetical protein
MADRHGNYPAPPEWPANLTKDAEPANKHPLDPINESPAVQHDYIADGWPGPCSISFRDGQFLSWTPALTVVRSERYARRA